MAPELEAGAGPPGCPSWLDQGAGAGSAQRAICLALAEPHTFSLREEHSCSIGKGTLATERLVYSDLPVPLGEHGRPGARSSPRHGAAGEHAAPSPPLPCGLRPRPAAPGGRPAGRVLGARPVAAHPANTPPPPRPSLAASAIDQPIKVDGLLDDEAWQQAD